MNIVIVNGVKPYIDILKICPKVASFQVGCNQ